MKILFLVLVCCLCGCAMFKKTSKTSAITKASSVKNLEATELILKRAGKETQTFTYWNDSGFYQIQQVREIVAQAERGELKIGQEENSREDVVIKTKMAFKPWIYAGVSVFLLLIFILWLKKRKR